MAFDAATYEIDPLTLTTPRARLEYMRDFLRGLPDERFDMKDVGALEDHKRGDCKSPACIAGWAGAKFRTDQFSGSLEQFGANLFGLSHTASNALFYPGPYEMADGAGAYDATPADAAQVLDHLLNTGKVDWSVARKVEA